MNTNKRKKLRFDAGAPLIAAAFMVLFYAGASSSAIDAKALFEQGMDAFKSGNYGSSELLLRKIVEANDDEYIDRAWFHLARSIFNRGKYELALFEFKNFLNKCKTDTLAAESRYWMGECYYNLSDFPNAIEEFRRYLAVAADGPFVSPAHDRIGQVYIEQKRYDEAIQEWEAARLKSTEKQKNYLRQYWIGDALYRKGSYDEAMQRLNAVVGVLTDARINAMADMVLGRIYQKKGDHAKALQRYAAIPAALLKEEPFIDVPYFKARSHRRLGQNQQARILLESFLAGGTASRWYRHAQYELGSILLQGADRENGLKLLDEVRSAGGTSLKTRAALLIGQYYAENDPERAIPFLEEALKTAKHDKRKVLLLVLGKTSMRAGRYGKSIDCFNQYLKDNPFDLSRDEINFLRARAYIEMGDADRGISIFNSIGKENPSSKWNIEANYYIALVRYKKGDTARAAALLQEYLKQKNTEQAYEACVLLMKLNLDKNNLDGAGRVADALAREFMNRKGVDAVLYDYAAALMKNGRDARRFVNLVLNRFPGTESAAELYFILGNESFSRGRFNAALECYNNYLISPYTKNRGNAFYNMIVSLYSLKRYDDVIAVVRKGDFPPMTESQARDVPLMQARSLYALKKLNDAYMVMDIKNVRAYSNEDILMYIRCALNAGDYRSAIEANEYLAKDKNMYAVSLYTIGDYLLRNENKESAELYFMKIISECPGTPYVDNAKVSLGEMSIMERKYPEAVKLLSEVGSAAEKTVQTRKISLLIRCYFEMDMPDKAVSLAEGNLQELAGSEFGGMPLLYLMRYYYKKKDLPQFERYAKLIVKYPGNEPEIEYLSGKIYFQSGNYTMSYNYFTSLLRRKGRHADEACYAVGLYNMLVARNTAAAMTYFKRLIDMEDADEHLKRKALIQCAILYREMNNMEQVQECLKKVLAVPHRGLAYIQAINLYDAFGLGSK